MKVLVKKMSSLKILKVELIFGTIFSAIAMIGIPVSIFCIAPDLLKEPLAWGIALGIMLFFGLVGYGLQWCNLRTQCSECLRWCFHRC